MAKRTEERLKCLQRVIEVDSSDKKAWKESGYCLLELRRYEEAAQAFDSVLRLDPFDEDCDLQKGIALAEISVGQAEDVNFMVVYDDSNGWHVTKEDDIQWEPERAHEDARERRRLPQSCYGPFFSNYDPKEGPVGSGKAQAEADAEEKRRLYAKGPPRRGAGS
jgi:tetratricopeptide (TPR) repeat protein